MTEFGRGLFSDLSWMLEGGRPAAGAWAAGAAGEQVTAMFLDRLGPGWHITHDVGYGRRGQNLDHVLVGPPGVVVVNAKYHGERLVHVHDDVHVDGRRVRHVPQGAAEAAVVSRALTRAAGRTVRASSLVAVVGTVMVTAPPSVRGVVVLPAEHAVAFLDRLPERLGPCAVRTLTLAVRSPATWLTDRPGARPAGTAAVRRP